MSRRNRDKHNGADIYLRGRKWWGKWQQGKNLEPLRESLRTESAELAAQLWHDREREIRSGVKTKSEITLGAASDLYWNGHVVPEKLASAVNIRLRMQRALKYFGANKVLTNIAHNDLKAWRNKLVAAGLGPASVNHHIRYLQRLCAFVEGAGHSAPHFRGIGKRGSKRILLEEPLDPPRTIDSEAEQTAVVDVASQRTTDILPMFRFGQLTGTRRTEMCNMTWAMVDWKAGLIRSRQKGNRPHVISITDAVYEILKGEFGNHPVHIFTWICRQTARLRRWTRKDGVLVVTREVIERVAGERYPFSKGVQNQRWNEVRKLAGTDVQWHAATRAFAIGQSGDQNGELATMEAMGIESPQTYRRYAGRHSDDRKRATLAAITTPRFKAAAFVMPAPKLALVPEQKAQIQHSGRRGTKIA